MRRFISRLVSKAAHRDREKSESVNILETEELARAMRARFRTVDWRLVNDLVRGEVLSDSRGEGSLQQVRTP
ncbi:MAG: hypothetical protein ACE5OO_03805 [Candidatus Bathyarchaeia archaeon]